MKSTTWNHPAIQDLSLNVMHSSSAIHAKRCRASLILEDAAEKKYHQIVSPGSPPLHLATILCHRTFLGDSRTESAILYAVVSITFSSLQSLVWNSLVLTLSVIPVSPPFLLSTSIQALQWCQVQVQCCHVNRCEHFILWPILQY